MNPTAAITKSSNLTYGEKGAIFLGTLVLGLIVGIVGAALAAIGASISEPMSVVLAIIGVALSLSVLICGSGYVYHTLAGDIDAQP